MIRVELKKLNTGIAIHETVFIATGTRVSYGIAQFYLPPYRGDIPALTPAKAGSRFAVPLKDSSY